MQGVLWTVRIGENPEIAQLKQQLQQCETYKEWKAVARRLDAVEGTQAVIPPVGSSNFLVLRVPV